MDFKWLLKKKKNHKNYTGAGSLTPRLSFVVCVVAPVYAACHFNESFSEQKRMFLFGCKPPRLSKILVVFLLPKYFIIYWALTCLQISAIYQLFSNARQRRMMMNEHYLAPSEFYHLTPPQNQINWHFTLVIFRNVCAHSGIFTFSILTFLCDVILCWTVFKIVQMYFETCPRHMPTDTHPTKMIKFIWNLQFSKKPTCCYCYYI